MKEDYCRKCGKMVYAKTLDFSVRVYGQPYCFGCQQGKKQRNEDGSITVWKPTPIKGNKKHVDKSFLN